MQMAKYAPEFKDEAVKQVVVRGHSIVDVAKLPGIPKGVLYTWVVGSSKRQTNPSATI